MEYFDDEKYGPLPEKNFLQVEQFNAEHLFVEDDVVLKTAKEKFKIEYLFPWQRLVISNILESYKNQNEIIFNDLKKKTEKDKDFSDAFCLGRQIVLLPTGAGKSLCFLVPSVLLDGPTLIIYPLLALMADQERRMKEAGIESVTFRGGQTWQEREKCFEKIKNGAKIILANPEVLENEKLLDRLKLCNISHIAIDEAHCISEWGDSFRPAYLTLGLMIKRLCVNIVTAFTATASPQVLSRIEEILFDSNSHLVRSESDRPNIHYFVKYVYAKRKAVFRLCKTEPRPILIFCGTRQKSEQMARELSAYFPKDEVRFYHAGMTKEEKKEVEKWYFPHKNAILCSTCAFGMGVDKSDIRTVIHYEPSSTAESYIQEAGRGGRDKKVSNAILLWSYEDSKNFSKYSMGTRESVIKNFAESKSCRRQILLDALGGEKTLCSGCDVCNSKKEGKKLLSLEDALDRKKMLNKIQFYKKYFTRDSLLPYIKNKFNQEDLKLFGENIWTEKDVEDIFIQLKDEGSVKFCSWPWKDKIVAVNDSYSSSSSDSFSLSCFG